MGRSGWPRRVSLGMGPERSRPNSRLVDAIEQPEGVARRLANRQALLRPVSASLCLHGSLGQGPLAHHEAQRATEQLGVGELLPRSGVAIVVEDLGPGPDQLTVQPIGRLAHSVVALAHPDQVDIPWRDRARPDDPLLVGPLLDRRRDYARRADPVAAHHDRMLLAPLVEIGGAERLRVSSAELEDAGDLDRTLDLDPAPAGH